LKEVCVGSIFFYHFNAIVEFEECCKNFYNNIFLLVVRKRKKIDIKICCALHLEREQQKKRKNCVCDSVPLRKSEKRDMEQQEM
jgi:hypothetical protein